jgi:S-DNA-T family DNA segregation ATPase FtsK/SpoIIIE
MQLALSVADPVTRSLSDVLVDVEDDATVDELALELARVMRAVPVGVSSLAAHRSGSVGAPSRLYVDGKLLDGRQSLRHSPLREGSVVGLDEPAPALDEPVGLFDLSITGGPGAGLVHRLAPGEADVGRDPSCHARFDAPGLPPHAFSVRVGMEECTLIPSDGVEVLLEHEPVVEPLAWPEGACVTVGDSLLVLRRVTSPDAALQPSEDGVSLDYNRPPRLLPPLRRTTFELPKPPTAPRGRSLPVLAILAPIVMATVLVLVLGSLRYALFAAMSPVMAIGSWVSSRTGARKAYREDLARYDVSKAAIEQDAQDALLSERARRRAQAPDPGGGAAHRDRSAGPAVGAPP